jgi:hypothetical protein
MNRNWWSHSTSFAMPFFSTATHSWFPETLSGWPGFHSGSTISSPLWFHTNVPDAAWYDAPIQQAQLNIIVHFPSAEMSQKSQIMQIRYLFRLCNLGCQRWYLKPVQQSERSRLFACARTMPFRGERTRLNNRECSLCWRGLGCLGLINCLWFYVPLKNFSLIWRRHHYR